MVIMSWLGVRDDSQLGHPGGMILVDVSVAIW